MVYGRITDDIIVQEGTFGYAFVASGTIYAGQVVKPAGPMQVVACDNCTENAIGVAAYYVTKGETVTVYGPGNIVRCYCASSIAVGADLYPGNNGCVDDAAVYGSTYPSIGVSLEGTVSGAVRTLLK